LSEEQKSQNLGLVKALAKLSWQMLKTIPQLIAFDA